MFEKHQRKFKRTAKLISVLSKYGFQDLLIRMNLKSEKDSINPETNLQLTLFERIRLALEELGPTFVKLGQSFSNREDILPMELIVQLQRLQDNVEVLDLDVPAILEEELGIVASEHFLEINPKPIASASIAQVYKAKLISGKNVIVKVKRPGIQAMIEDDLLILKDLVKIIDTYSEIGDQMNLKHALVAFEKSILLELSLVNERNNIQQFAINFQNHPDTYVPKVYDEYCSNRVLTMEFIEGVKITDVEKLREKGIDPKKISELGLKLFVMQILEFGFFHADPHPGNILVNDQGQVIFIDFGAVGVVQPNDISKLENLIMAFMNKKSDKIVRNLKKLAVYYNIPDDRKFESDVYTILNQVHRSSLRDINIADMLDSMRAVLAENRLVMPEYFYLLFKGFTLMDGVGRAINPDLDVVEALKPYTKKIFLKKFNPETLARKSWDRATDLIDHVEEIPYELRSILNKLDDNKFSVTTDSKNIDKIARLVKSSIVNLILGLILSANLISTAILWGFDVGPSWGSFHLLGALGFLVSILIAAILVLRILRR
ncbi:ABC1 kinase family protein [Moheibacter stercoris]|uniref:Ubiquinone biosynthesis protein n=1 Tax=Moheibacter stercoris TaxID=1628251 RepID=A0ABV2LV77_9FLAO